MSIPFSWTPKSIIPGLPEHVSVTTLDNKPVTLANPITITNGQIDVQFDKDGKYKIVVKTPMGREIKTVQAIDDYEDGLVLSVRVMSGQEARPKVSTPVLWIGSSSKPINFRMGDVWLGTSILNPEIPPDPDPVVIGTEHSIYTTTYPYTLNVYTDGPGKDISVATSFYTATNSPTSDWRVRGTRLFIPDSFTTHPQSADIFLRVSTTNTQESINTAMANAPVRVATLSNLATGWNDVYFDTAFDIIPGQILLVGYQFVEDKTVYMAASKVGDAPTQSTTTDYLYEAEELIRSSFRYSDGNSGVNGGYWGLDIIVDEGPEA